MVESSHGDELRGHGNARSLFIASIDREIADCKWRTSSIRATLVISLVALSSLFWSIADTIRDGQMGLDVLVDVSPYVVSVISFAVSASALYSIYLSKYEPREVGREESKLLEVLPHVIVLILIVLVAAGASAVSLIHSLQIEFGFWEGAAYFVAFGFALVIFLIMAYSLIGWTRGQEGSQVSREEESGSHTSFGLTIGRVLYVTAALYLMIGVFTLCLAWSLNDRIVLFLLAVQGSGVLILIFFVFDRVDSLLNELRGLNSLREERAIAIHEGLGGTGFEERYMTLATVDIEIRE